MMVGERIKERLASEGMSQAELARRVQLSQPAINGLIRGASRSSTHLHRIARALNTTPAYLSGEIDDPDEGAAPPAPAPIVQFVTLPVALPSEAALADAFEGLLLASPRMAGAELAHELARRLPTLLRVAAGALAAPPSADPAAPREAEAVPDDDRREPRRASRT